MSETDKIGAGDRCPRCGIEIDFDDDGDRSAWLVHPDPQCGWQPDGYPSTRAGSGREPLCRVYAGGPS